MLRHFLLDDSSNPFVEMMEDKSLSREATNHFFVNLFLQHREYIYHQLKNRLSEEALLALGEALEKRATENLRIDSLESMPKLTPAEIQYRSAIMQQAVKIFKDVIARNPLNSAAFMSLRRICDHLKHLLASNPQQAEEFAREVEKYFQHTLTIDSNYYYAYDALAKMALERGDLLQACELWIKSYEIEYNIKSSKTGAKSPNIDMDQLLDTRKQIANQLINFSPRMINWLEDDLKEDPYYASTPVTLGIVYFFGLGVERDISRARELFIFDEEWSLSFINKIEDIISSYQDPSLPLTDKDTLLLAEIFLKEFSTIKK